MQQPVALKTDESVQQAVGLDNFLASVPWGHHVVLINKLKDPEEAIFYLQQTIENNWSRAVLTLQVEQNLFGRQGKAINNFHQTLPEKQALLAGQILKDPYNFGFLTLEPKLQELDLERQLTEHITKFLLELGKGFAFVFDHKGRSRPSTACAEAIAVAQASISNIFIFSYRVKKRRRINVYFSTTPFLFP